MNVFWKTINAQLIGFSNQVRVYSLTSELCGIIQWNGIDSRLMQLFNHTFRKTRNCPLENWFYLETLNSFESLSIEELNFLAGVVSTDAGGALGGGGMINAKIWIDVELV